MMGDDLGEFTTKGVLRARGKILLAPIHFLAGR
jgi:hypothetical protein